MVNYNGLHFLKACLPTIYKNNYPRFELILVDNNSKDNSVQYIEQRFPQIKIVQNKKNEGFAEANNIGYSKSKGKYILFLNNDTKVTKNFLSELVKGFDDNKKIAGFQSKILLMDDLRYLDSVGSFLTHSGFLYHYGANKRDSKKYNKQIPIFSAKGASMVFRKDVLEKTSLNGNVFDSDYFAYFEETDLCHRIWLAGFNIEYLPTALIYHKGGGTSRNMDSSFIQYHSFKNRINTYIKNLSFKTLLWYIPFHLCMVEIFALFSLLRLNMPMFFTLQKAIAWNVFTLKHTLKKRQQVQLHIRKISDRELFSQVMVKVGLSYYLDLPFGLKRFKDLDLQK